jgi:hypothetical protein
MLENDESFSTESLDNPETLNPISVLSFNTNNEMKNNIEKCVQQEQQTIVEDNNVQHPTTVMRTLVTHYLRSTQQQNEFRRTLLRVYNSTCSVTKCCIPSVLEACHLIPFSEGGNFKPSNGIRLRADLHQLLGKDFFVDRNMAGLRPLPRLTLGLEERSTPSGPSRHLPGTSRSRNCSQVD